MKAILLFTFVVLMAFAANADEGKNCEESFIGKVVQVSERETPQIMTFRGEKLKSVEAIVVVMKNSQRTLADASIRKVVSYDPIDENQKYIFKENNGVVCSLQRI